MRSIRHIIVLTFFLGQVFPGVAASITVSNESPQVGEQIIITLDIPVDTLTITYRPSSSVVKTELLVNRPPATFFEWASKNPGLVSLSYLDKSQATPVRVSRNLSIRFDGISTSGLSVMILAGLILFGGAGFAFRTLFQDQDQDGTLDFDPEHLPDT